MFRIKMEWVSHGIDLVETVMFMNYYLNNGLKQAVLDLKFYVIWLLLNLKNKSGFEFCFA